MTKEQRGQLIERMGGEIGLISQYLEEQASGLAREAYVRFMIGAGLLAVEIDETSPAARTN